MAKKGKLVKLDKERRPPRVTLVAEEPSNIEQLFHQACRLTPGVDEHTGEIQQGNPIFTITSMVGSRLRELINRQEGAK